MASTQPLPVDDAELTRTLADVMGHLRSRAYAGVLGQLPMALRGSADGFIDTLARHLLYEEQVLFPPLMRTDPETAEAVRSLQAEHRRLRELATELAREIKCEAIEKAYAVAREFLAELYGHMDREAAVTGPVEGTGSSHDGR